VVDAIVMASAAQRDGNLYPRTSPALEDALPGRAPARQDGGALAADATGRRRAVTTS
jgi:hypothetical protein